MVSQERPFGVPANVGDVHPVEAASGSFLGNLSVGGRANLLIALALATLAAFLAINLSGEIWLKTSLQRQLTIQKIERIVSDVAEGGLRMRRWETDFFLRNDPEDAAAYEVDAARVLEKLGALARIPEAENATIHVDTLSDGIEQHIAQFKKFVNLERILGLSDREGLRGRLGDSARALQNILDLSVMDNLTATVLLMRSQEKDFILDGGREHLRRMVELSDKFAVHLANAPLSAVDKTRISLLIESYLSNALAFGEVRLSQDVEIKRLGEIFAYVAPNIEALADSARNSAAKANARLGDTRDAMRYLGRAGNGGAGILFVVFSIGVARSISRPLSQLVDAARLVADGAPGVFIPAQQNRDEIGAIALSLGVIAGSLSAAEMRRLKQEDTLQIAEVCHH
ncbi:MAG: HAMP domain-containing protein [Rhodospirillales bacterium]|nr:HAMP domain-containing protein [Rhodospirillales bacterium]